MSFSFGNPTNPPKPATGFTLPGGAVTNNANTAAAPSATQGFQFNVQQASGDNKQPTISSGGGGGGGGLFSLPSQTGGATNLSFNLGPPKTAHQTAAPPPVLNFGAPLTQTVQPSVQSRSSFGLAPTASVAASGPQNLSFGGIGTSTSAGATTTPAAALSFTPILGTIPSSSVPAANNSTPASGLFFSTAAPASAAAAPPPKFGLAAPASVTSIPGTASSSSAAAGGFSLNLSTTQISSIAPTQTTSTTVAAASIPTTISTSSSSTSLNFAQLEDSINKWTIDLEEQGKFFVNQAKQLNAWDSLLISNGEKILNLNSSIERVKQQQCQLDQELDFIVAQQKELEELILPFEKEIIDVPVTDIDRNQMYQYAEIIDSQLKQISDDLKEIIDNINESNKGDEVSNPIQQIGKILNAHMNSLQWIDKNTALISKQLEEVTKLENSSHHQHSKRIPNNSFSLY